MFYEIIGKRGSSTPLGWRPPPQSPGELALAPHRGRGDRSSSPFRLSNIALESRFSAWSGGVPSSGSVSGRSYGSLGFRFAKFSLVSSGHSLRRSCRIPERSSIASWEHAVASSAFCALRAAGVRRGLNHSSYRPWRPEVPRRPSALSSRTPLPSVPLLAHAVCLQPVSPAIRVCISTLVGVSSRLSYRLGLRGFKDT